jgi:hypothetical protein
LFVVRSLSGTSEVSVSLGHHCLNLFRQCFSEMTEHPPKPHHHITAQFPVATRSSPARLAAG